MVEPWEKKCTGVIATASRQLISVGLGMVGAGHTGIHDKWCVRLMMLSDLQLFLEDDRSSKVS
jgi:hypothetical protein